MKIINTGFFLLMTLTLCGQVNDADAFFNGTYDKFYIRKHKIKRVAVKTYIIGKESSLHFFDFDRRGFLTKQSIFDSSGKKVNDYIFKYNNQNDQTERKNIDYELNKTYIVTFHRAYKRSQLIQEKSSQLPFITKYIYNAKGQKIQSVITHEIDSTNAGKRIFYFSYDSKRRLKSVRETYVNYIDSTPINIGIEEYIYDAAGKVIAIIRQGKANYELSYDKNGLLKSKTIKMPGDLGGMEIMDKYTYSHE